MSDAKTFRCFLTNFGYYLSCDHDTLEAALAYGRSKGFQFVVHCGGHVVAAWCPIGGTRRL